MQTYLRPDIIDILKGFLGDRIPDGCFRSGRIEYELSLKRETLVEYRIFAQELAEWNEKFPLLAKEGKSPKDYFRINILQKFWINEKEIIASGFYISSDSQTETLLAQVFFITDEFGEPSSENTKFIEWDIDNELKIVLVLPKKISKEETCFSLLCGKKNFFEKTDIWKTNL
jgi:hypothetical protein